MAEAVNVGAIEVRIDLLTADFKKSQNEIKDKLKQIETQSVQTTSIFSSAWTRAAGIAAAACATIIAGALKTIQANVELARSAEALGVAVESLGRWQAAAKSAGIRAEEFQRSVKTLYMRMSERGITDEGVRNFAALGISVKDSSGKLKTLDEIMPQLAAKFSTMKDGVEKVRIATALFGEKGHELLVTLNKGPAALDAMRDRAQSLGIVLSKDAAEASIKFNRTLNEVTGAMDLVATAATNRIIPALQGFADRMKGVADSGTFVRIAVETIVVAFKAVSTVVESVLVRFEQISIAFTALARAAKTAAGGEFREAMDIMKQSGADMSAANEAFLKRVKDLWTETPAVVDKGAKEIQKKAAPVVKTSEEITKAIERIKQLNAFMFEDIKGDKKMPLHEKIEALNQMLNENKITDLEYIKTIKDLNAELERETLQRTLDIDTVPIMTKMQALEDAKERGVINWGEYSDSMERVRKSGAQQMDDLASATSGALTSIFKKSKTAAIASALINTYQGITKAIATYPPPLSYAMAGIQGALGFAQVAAIRSQSDSGGGSGSSGSSGASAAQSAPQVAPAATQSTLTVQGINAKGLFTGDVVRSLADQLLQFQRDGGRVILT